jgi:hypothetical protein
MGSVGNKFDLTFLFPEILLTLLYTSFENGKTEPF